MPKNELGGLPFPPLVKIEADDPIEMKALSNILRERLDGASICVNALLRLRFLQLINQQLIFKFYKINKMRIQSLKILGCLLLSFLLLHAGPVLAANSGYYIQNGNAIFEVKDGDPSKVEAVEWQIRLHKKNQPTTGVGSRHWGLITGKTLESVNRQLRSSQKFEKTFEKWSGGYFGPETYFNPFGPIAIVKTNKPKVLAALDAADNLVSKFQDLQEGYAKIMDAIGTTPKDHNPFANVGTVLKEYTDNFKHTQQKFAELKQKLALGDIEMNEFGSNLNSLSQELPAIKQQEKSLEKKIPTLDGGWRHSLVRYETTANNIVEDEPDIRGGIASLHIHFEDKPVQHFVETRVDVLNRNLIIHQSNDSDGEAKPLEVHLAAIVPSSLQIQEVALGNNNFSELSFFTTGQQGEGTISILYNDQRAALNAESAIKMLIKGGPSRLLRSSSVVTAPVSLPPHISTPPVNPRTREQQEKYAVSAAEKAYDQGSLTEAAHQWRTALHMNPKNFKANGNLGLILYQQKDYKNAEIFMRKAVELNPHDARTVNNLGQLYLDSGKDPLIAEQLCRRATELEPKEPETHDSLAQCLLKLGRREEATQEAKTALQLGYVGNSPLYKELHLR